MKEILKPRLLRKPFFDSSSEYFCYLILKNYINTRYFIFPHVSMNQLFSTTDCQVYDNWMLCHIDFVIFDEKFYPVAGIEINGIQHENSAKRKAFDSMKRVIFSENQIPFIAIPISEIIFSEQNNYMEKLNDIIREHLIGFLSSRTEYPAYCWICGQPMHFRTRKDKSSSFYCCINPNCKRKQENKTISSVYIPELLV